jgi:peptide/nickel transport system substrate-binding protein
VRDALGGLQFPFPHAELQRLVRDEAPWVFLWQQHDLYGVAQTIEWTPRADEKVWMYDAKIVAR